METEKKRELIPVLELTDKDTGEQIYIPCTDGVKLALNTWNFLNYQPVDEDYVWKKGDKNVKKKTHS